MAGKKKAGQKRAPESSADMLRKKNLAMVENIPPHQFFWMISAAQEHFVAKIESQELKILRAERFRAGEKENHWDEKTIAETPTSEFSSMRRSSSSSLRSSGSSQLWTPNGRRETSQHSSD